MVVADDAGDVDGIIDAAELTVDVLVEGGDKVWAGDVAVDLEDFSLWVVLLDPCACVGEEVPVEVCDGYARAA